MATKERIPSATLKTLRAARTYTPACPAGEILRKPYTAERKSGPVRVAATCVEKRGSAEPSAVRIPLGDDIKLGEFGYHAITRKTAAERHEALAKAVAAFTPLKVERRLTALATLTKNTARTQSDLMMRDQNWIARTYRAAPSKA